VKSLDFPIVGDSNDVAQDDPQLTTNWYAEKVSEDVVTLKPTPGTVSYAQFVGGGRGQITVADRYFAVAGSQFQEWAGGVAVIRGILASSSGKVSIISAQPPGSEGFDPDTENQSQVLIVDDAHGYVFKLSDNSFTQLTEAMGFVGGGSQAAFCAGRALVFKPGTTFFQMSAQYDFLTWDTTVYASAESLKTPIKAVASNGDLAYFWSSDGFEVWQDQGEPVLPIRRILAGDNKGILAPFSALFIERYVYWLAGNGQGRGVVYRHEGGGLPERVSNHSTERQIAALSSQDDAIGLTYESLGHVFYMLNFTEGNKTLCFDRTTGLWHDRAQRDPVSAQLFGLPFVSLIIFEGSILALNIQNGQVVQLSDTVYTDLGNPIARDRVTSVFPVEGDSLTYGQSVELFGETGNTPIGQDDPQIMMRYSIDRGKTWSLEEWQQVGGNNSYEGRTRWIGLGAAYGFCFWFRIVSNQYVTWRGLRLRVE
jgi:hypothetical protein